MSCRDCVHWIGEPINYCELGPNQGPVCARAEEDAPADGESREWVEEFGGGEWVYDSPAQDDVLQQKAPLPSAGALLNAIIYPKGYQGPGASRNARGIWVGL